MQLPSREQGVDLSCWRATPGSDKPIPLRWMTLTEVFAGAFISRMTQIQDYSTALTDRMDKTPIHPVCILSGSALFKKGKKNVQLGEGGKVVSNLYIPYQKDFYTPPSFSTGTLTAKLPLQKSLQAPSSPKVTGNIHRMLPCSLL